MRVQCTSLQRSKAFSHTTRCGMACLPAPCQQLAPCPCPPNPSVTSHTFPATRLSASHSVVRSVLGGHICRPASLHAACLSLHKLPLSLSHITHTHSVQLGVRDIRPLAQHHSIAGSLPSGTSGWCEPVTVSLTLPRGSLTASLTWGVNERNT